MSDELFPEVARTPRAPRLRDEVWDALVAIFGEPTTRSNRTLRNKIVVSLKGAGATYAEIHARAVTWPAHFPGATLTETALEVHWDRLGRPPLRATELQNRELEAEMDKARLRAWAMEQEAHDETDRGRSLDDDDDDRDSIRPHDGTRRVGSRLDTPSGRGVDPGDDRRVEREAT